MSDPCEEICDALVELLNSAPDGTFSLEFIADKPADPNGELDKLSDNVRVLFWPHSEEETKIGRGGKVIETFGVAMLVIRKLADAFTPPLMHGFVRELKDYIRGKKAGCRHYSRAETTLTDLAQLHEHKQIAVGTIFYYRGTA